ncbi:hypothetical protein BMR08_15375 [Methylococcaceae bacterium CS2]|nr:hypothetical protein BMR08_15375 [Methylococcaceae bacterium CS2]
MPEDQEVCAFDNYCDRTQCSHRFPSGDALIQHYSFNETDLALISQHRGSENRLGFAMQLCYMRYPGIIHQ